MKRFFARRRYKQAVDEALVQIAAKKPDAAREALKRAAVDADLAFEERGVDVATVRYALAANELEAGEVDAALEDARRSDRALEATTPAERAAAGSDEAPSASRIRALIASILERKGVGGEEYETALSSWAEAAKAGDDDESAGAALNQLALAIARGGDRERAAPHFLEAVRHRTRRFGADGLPTLETLYNAATFRDAGRTLDVVASDLERIVSATKALPGARAAELHESSLHNLGALREEQGDDSAAEAAFERSLAAREARLGKDHVSLRPTLVRLAQIQHRAGQLIHALGLYDRAHGIAKRELGEEHPIVVAIDAWRSEVTQGLGPAAIRRN